MSIRIGDTVLRYGMMLAPMAGVTDRSFRSICHDLGAEYTVSEMISAKALCYEQMGKRREAATVGTAPLADISEDKGPIALQIFGHEPEFMAEAAKMLEDSSYRGCISKKRPAAIDINMGCPVRKITGNGEGSALMKDAKLAGDICRAVSDAVRLPVTVKIRSGWDAESINAVEFSKVLEASGASLICVHARTREQLYSPGIDLGIIEKVKKAVSIPVIGNGDIYSAAYALAMMDKTVCDGVMIGRGAMGNPWIFSELRARLSGERFELPTPLERIALAEKQLDMMIAHKGERVGIAEGKKHMAWYLSGMRGAARARNEIMNANNRDEIRAILETLSVQKEDLE